jgi:hypothetical protein
VLGCEGVEGRCHRTETTKVPADHSADLIDRRGHLLTRKPLGLFTDYQAQRWLAASSHLRLKDQDCQKTAKRITTPFFASLNQ